EAGVECPAPAGTFYLWVPAPGGDAWALARWLARTAGAVVSPGEFYGEAGAGHVRIAVVQPDDQLALVAQRLAAAPAPVGDVPDAGGPGGGPAGAQAARLPPPGATTPAGGERPARPTVEVVVRGRRCHRRHRRRRGRRVPRAGGDPLHGRRPGLRAGARPRRARRAHRGPRRLHDLPRVLGRRHQRPGG